MIVFFSLHKSPLKFTLEVFWRRLRLRTSLTLLLVGAVGASPGGVFMPWKMLPWLTAGAHFRGKTANRQRSADELWGVASSENRNTAVFAQAASHIPGGKQEVEIQ